MRGGFGLLLAAGLALGSAGVGAETERSRLERQQAELERQRQEKEREREESSRRARSLREDADRTTKELASARRALAQTESRLEEAERRRGAAEERLWASRRSLGKWEDRLGEAVSAHYRRWVVGAEGALELPVYEAALIQERVSGLRFAVDNHGEVVLLRDELQEIAEDLQGLKLERERDRNRIERARERMRDLAKTEEGRQAVLEREIEELNASARRFAKTIQDLIEKERVAREKRAPAKTTPKTSGVSPARAERWRGKLGWPVRGEVVEKFGRTRHPELEIDIVSNGVRLRGAADEPARAVQAGEVLFSGPFMNYGLMALVSHEDGLHTIYANLGKLLVSTGQTLALGDPVGLLGRDDQDRLTLYFEMRIDGQAVDPAQWVR